MDPEKLRDLAEKLRFAPGDVGNSPEETGVDGNDPIGVDTDGV
jgi:hypothetical protein